MSVRCNFLMLQELGCKTGNEKYWKFAVLVVWHFLTDFMHISCVCVYIYIIPKKVLWIYIKW